MPNLQTLINAVLSLIRLLLPMTVGVALLVFFWGMVRFLSRAGSDKAAEEGRNLMVWGIIALFVMVSVWSLVFAIRNGLGIFNNTL